MALQTAKPFILTRRMEEILIAVHDYRYVTALDMAHLLFSPGSKPYVLELLTTLAGKKDFQEVQYLYRFQLPHTKTGNTERIFTLGSQGRDFLTTEVGLPVMWHFRPDKVRHLNYGHILHNLILTRFLVAAHHWSRGEANPNLVHVRTHYELAKLQNQFGEENKMVVIPDAWLLFEKDGKKFPILLEIDRGMEYQNHFKQHVQGRIELIGSGKYAEVFGEKSVTIAYVTTGDRASFRQTRLTTMRKWTREVLADLHKERWAGIFRFTSLEHEMIYKTPLFDTALWFRPDSEMPILLFSG